MNKTGLRVILVSFFIVLFGGSFFSVLAVEENNRLAKSKANQEQFLSDVQALDRARQAYLESVLESRTASKEGMAVAKAQYEALLKNQPTLIAQNQKQTTTTVKQQVPVASSGNSKSTKSSGSSSVKSTQASKPAATRTTKTS
ncbi:MAG: hypothetical protein Q7S04_01600 [Candidatus Moranbacteria bacterium]|nr:hypothetical protein [Candidatus Moranbacteria bacterium]